MTTYHILPSSTIEKSSVLCRLSGMQILTKSRTLGSHFPYRRPAKKLPLVGPEHIRRCCTWPMLGQKAPTGQATCRERRALRANVRSEKSEKLDGNQILLKSFIMLYLLVALACANIWKMNNVYRMYGCLCMYMYVYVCMCMYMYVYVYYMYIYRIITCFSKLLCAQACIYSFYHMY